MTTLRSIETISRMVDILEWRMPSFLCVVSCFEELRASTEELELSVDVFELRTSALESSVEVFELRTRVLDSTVEEVVASVEELLSSVELARSTFVDRSL